MAIHKNSQLEAFLREIEVCMSEVPNERRTEMLEETREHLESIYAARLYDGLSEKEAWQVTERAFGDATAIGNAMAAEWRRTPRYETTGIPLSRQDRWKIIARFTAVAVMFALASVLFTGWPSYHLKGNLLFPLAIIGLIYTIREVRKNGIAFTLGRLVSLFLPLIVLLIIGIKDQLARPLSNSTSISLDILFAIAICIVPLLTLKHRKKEEHLNMPWRLLPRYASSPLAAEEEYRLNPSINSVVSSFIVGLIFLWFTWPFFGATYAFVAFASVGALHYLLFQIRSRTVTG